MELEKQLEYHNQDISYEIKRSKQQREHPREVIFENNTAWNQLLEWGKANPDIMMNYVKYPLQGIQSHKIQAENYTKEFTSDSECCGFKEIPIIRYLKQINPEVSQQDNESQLRFQIRDFQDEQLNFDNQDNNVREIKEIVFDQNNENNFGSEVERELDCGGQIEQKSKLKQPFFEEALSQVFQLNKQNNTEINYIQLPSKPKRVYKKRKNFNKYSEHQYLSQTNINQRYIDYQFKKVLLPKHRMGGLKAKKMSYQLPFFMNARADECLKSKKITIPPTKKYLHNMLSKEEELQQLQHLNKNEQIAYVDNRIRHYNQLKNMIIKNKPKDEDIDEVFKSDMEKNNDRMTLYKEKNKNKETTEVEENSVLDEKTGLTPELLRMLSGKFQLYKNYEQGKYEPGYKMSLASIANQFQLSTSTVTTFYEQWQIDPNFSEKIRNMQKHSSLSCINNLSEASKKSTLAYNIRQQSLHLQNNFRTVQKILEMRKVFTERFKKLKSKEARLYFLDECHKEMIMGTNRIEEQAEGKQIDFSLMSLLGIKGRASWKVVKWSGQKYQEIDDIIQLYKNVRDDQKVDLNQVVKKNRSYLILDPFVVKQPQKIRKIQQMTNTKVLLFPQFSKQLNPLQFWFSDVKGKLRMTAKSLVELNKVLQKFSDIDFGKYLSDAERYMSLALQKRDF